MIQIVDKSESKEDIAKESELQFYFLDDSQDMLDIAQKNINEQSLTDRIKTIKGDVENIPLPDQSVNLAVSRGSIFFWQDRVKAFKEIYRVLGPSGVAYIGGGFGSSAIKAQIDKKMDELDKGSGKWQKKVEKNLGADAPKEFEAALNGAGIKNFKIIHTKEKGVWAIFRR